MRLLKIVGTVPLFLVAAFCVFGFLASFEPGPGQRIFRIGYPLLALGSLGAAAWLPKQEFASAAGSADEAD